MIEDINLIANYCHVDWLDRRVGGGCTYVYSIVEIRQLACKFYEYPKGLNHWKGEQLFDVIYSTKLFVLDNFII
jgi:hypothetical protein